MYPTQVGDLLGRVGGRTGDQASQLVYLHRFKTSPTEDKFEDGEMMDDTTVPAFSNSLQAPAASATVVASQVTVVAAESKEGHISFEDQGINQEVIS